MRRDERRRVGVRGRRRGSDAGYKREDILVEGERVYSRAEPFRFQSVLSVPHPDLGQKKKKETIFQKKKNRINLNLPPKMSQGPRPTTASPPPLAGFRLGFSPSYILVGVYRLSADPLLRVPVWDKCKHGFVRGLLVGLAWVSPRTSAIDASHDHRRACILSPGLFHVRNSKELHPALPVKVRFVPPTPHA